MRLRRQLRTLQAGFFLLAIATSALAWRIVTWPEPPRDESAMGEAISFDERTAPLAAQVSDQALDIDRLQRAVEGHDARLEKAELGLAEAQREIDSAARRAEQAWRKAMEPCLIYGRC